MDDTIKIKSEVKNEVKNVQDRPLPQICETC